MTKTTFKSTSIQFLYLREPLGIYYARVSKARGTTWISLRTRVFQVAKVELARHLQAHYAVANAEESSRSGKATMEELSVIYLQEVGFDVSIKASTKEYRGKTVRYLFNSWPTLKNRFPNQVSQSECRKWAATYSAKFSETLYNNTLDSLRHIFALAISRGLTARNPAAELDKVRVPVRKLDLPSSEQFRKIVESVRTAGSATSQGCGDLIEFLAYSGMRANEAAGIRWQDVDFGRGYIYVAPGKNSQSRRVPLLNSMRDLLTRIQTEPRWYRDEERRKGGFVLSVIECEKALTRACQKTGVQRMTRHSLRHLFATRCIESGIDIPTVSRFLGHKDGGAMAMRVYGHLSDEHSQAMAKKVTF